jgi:hypothetical protein
MISNQNNGFEIKLIDDIIDLVDFVSNKEV